MPFTTTWVEPEVRLEHNDIFVYCTYKHDDFDNYGPYTYFFTLDANHVDMDGLDFDVRELPLWKSIITEFGNDMTEQAITYCLERSIDNGDLKLDTELSV